jgi:nitrous oxidase accessory protein
MRFFAIYLQRSEHCEVRGNDIARRRRRTRSVNGNGVHLWHSPYTRVLDNHIRGQRDGIYFEFSLGPRHGATSVEGEQALRPALHVLRFLPLRAQHIPTRNGAGVAVMYSKGGGR